MNNGYKSMVVYFEVPKFRKLSLDVESAKNTPPPPPITLYRLSIQKIPCPWRSSSSVPTWLHHRWQWFITVTVLLLRWLTYQFFLSSLLLQCSSLLGHLFLGLLLATFVLGSLLHLFLYGFIIGGKRVDIIFNWLFLCEYTGCVKR